MARPRTDDPVQNRTIGLRRSEWEDFDEDAAAAGCKTRNAFLRVVMAERRLRPPTAERIDTPWGPPIKRAAKAKKAAKKQVIHIQARGHAPGCGCLVCQ